MFFYAYTVMVSSTDPGWLQTIFDMLMGFLYLLGLTNNVQKAVGMVCHPCREVRVRADKAYTQQVTGVGWYYKERQRELVN